MIRRIVRCGDAANVDRHQAIRGMAGKTPHLHAKAGGRLISIKIQVSVSCL
jgi:hypothetical protein